MNCRRLPDEILQKLNLKDSGKHVGMSFAMDLILYERGDLIVSNYDFTISQPEKYDPDLSKKCIWLVFCKKQGYVRYMKFSHEIIVYEPDFFNEEVERMTNDILAKVN